MTYTAADCQGFAGGMTLGMVQAGFELIAKREHPAGFGAPNCENNRHLLGSKWQTQCSDASEWEPVSADLVFGNPPCSGFSVASNRDFRGANSPVNSCMWDLIGYAARCRPQVVAFESVTPAITREDGRQLMLALREDLERRTNEGWQLTHVKHDAYALGGIATRRRYFFVAHRIPFGVDSTPLNRDRPVLWDALEDLVPLDTKWGPQAHAAKPSPWAFREVRNGSTTVDGHHQAGTEDHLHRRRVQAYFDAGVDWREGDTVEMVGKRYFEEHGELPEPWTVNQLHSLVNREWRSGFFPTVRWRSDRPGRVIYGGSPHNAIHPTLPRQFTHREVARVMGFPDDWLIEPLREERGADAFWGKGITVQAGRWLGNQIRRALDGNPGDYIGELIGDSERLIEIKPAKKEAPK